MILVWIWIEQVFLDSWSHDKRWLRERAGNRAQRPAKHPLLWFSDHWKCPIVEIYFSVSGSFWAIFNLLQTSPCVFHTRWDGFVQSEFWKSKKTAQTTALLYTIRVNENATKPNHAIHLVQHLFTVKNHWRRHWNIAGSIVLVLTWENENFMLRLTAWIIPKKVVEIKRSCSRFSLQK